MNKTNTVSISVVIEGARACFRRPESTTDLVSYDIIPPYAADQILRHALHLGPRRWSIDRIRVAKPIKFISDQVSSDRGPRRALLLDDVRYVVEACISCSAEEEAELQIIINESLATPQNVYLGLAECPGIIRSFKVCDINQNLIDPCVFDLGWMVRTQKSDKDRFPIFFRARLVDGVVDVRGSSLTAS